MWYKCLNRDCGFVFSRVGECTQCPDCGKEMLREATTEEIGFQNIDDKTMSLKHNTYTNNFIK